MYYGSMNFEVFARPRKPKGVDEKSAYIVGAGIGSLAAAAFLIRDGHMDGSRITILEASKLPAAHWTASSTPQGDLWSEATESSQTTCSACGTSCARSPRSRWRAPRCLTSSIGSRRTTPTARCGA